jgi:MerR family glutamine synthetase transcriptional repressor
VGVERVPMRVAVQQSGLTPRQIRYYEDQGLLHPMRTKGGQRLYTAEEVELLRQIRIWMAEGSTLEAVRQRLRRAPAEAESERPERPPRLTSLYPVSNRAELERVLSAEEEEDER